MCYEPYREGKMISVRLEFPHGRVAEAADAKLWGQGMEVKRDGVRLVVSQHTSEEPLLAAVALVQLKDKIQQILGSDGAYRVL